MNRRTPPSLVARWSFIAAFGFSLVPRQAWAQAPESSPPPADSATKDAAADPAAPNDEAIAEAARRYDMGLKLYAEGEFRQAVIEFERSYKITSDYRVLYNIGQVRIQLGNYARATVALNDYLKQGGDKISEDRRKAVEADLEMLASRTGHMRIVVNQPGADIFIDDIIVGQSPLAEPVMLDAGEHKVTARKRGYEGRPQQITLAGRDSMLVEVKLEKLPEGGQKLVIREVQKEDNTTWMIAAWSATGVLAVGAGVTGGLGIKASNDLEDMRKEEGSTNDERESQADRAQTLLLAADIMGAAAVVTGGIALYLTLSGSGSDNKEAPPKKAMAREPRTSLVLAPNRIGLRGEF
jgi:hypothetical protein